MGGFSWDLYQLYKAAEAVATNPVEENLYQTLAQRLLQGETWIPGQPEFDSEGLYIVGEEGTLGAASLEGMLGTGGIAAVAILSPIVIKDALDKSLPGPPNPDGSINTVGTMLGVGDPIPPPAPPTWVDDSIVDTTGLPQLVDVTGLPKLTVIPSDYAPSNTSYYIPVASLSGSTGPGLANYPDAANDFFERGVNAAPPWVSSPMSVWTPPSLGYDVSVPYAPSDGVYTVGVPAPNIDISPWSSSNLVPSMFPSSQVFPTSDFYTANNTTDLLGGFQPPPVNTNWLSGPMSVWTPPPTDAYVTPTFTPGSYQGYVNPDDQGNVMLQFDVPLYYTFSSQLDASDMAPLLYSEPDYTQSDYQLTPLPLTNQGNPSSFYYDPSAQPTQVDDSSSASHASSNTGNSPSQVQSNSSFDASNITPPSSLGQAIQSINSQYGQGQVDEFGNDLFDYMGDLMGTPPDFRVVPQGIYGSPTIVNMSPSFNMAGLLGNAVYMEYLNTAVSQQRYQINVLNGNIGV